MASDKQNKLRELNEPGEAIAPALQLVEDQKNRRLLEAILLELKKLNTKLTGGK